MNNQNYNPQMQQRNQPMQPIQQRMQPQMQQRNQPMQPIQQRMQPQMQQRNQPMQPQMQRNQPMQSQMQRNQPMQPQMQRNQPMQPQMQRNQQMQPQINQQSVKIGAENQYILYYSNYCINCKEFMNILCKNPLYNKFKKINVSDGSANIPPFVKNVPTILVPNYNHPLVGEDVFKWLEESSEKRMNNLDQTIIPFHPDEMDCGLGDNYSYLDIKDNEQPMEHNFVYIKKGDQKIETPPEESFDDTKLKSQDTSNRQPVPQRQMSNIPNVLTNPLSSPIIPQSSVNDKTNVEDAYNELLARRKTESPETTQMI
jgi:glutaredoxin-related protein